LSNIKTQFGKQPIGSHSGRLWLLWRRSSSEYIAIVAVRRSDKNASVAMLITLSEAFRVGWQRVIASIKSIEKDPNAEDTRYTTFSELLNLFEIACAIMNEKFVAGFSREIIHKYLVDSLGLSSATIMRECRFRTC
jgi:hypothetical protein